MRKVLFIGNFLSKHRGTIGPVEGVMDRLKDDFSIIKASTFDNKVLKIGDMFFKAAFHNYDTIHIDTYSSSALYFAFLTAFLGRSRRKKVILNLHGGALYRLTQVSNLKRKLIRQLFSFASNIVTPSLYLKEKLSQEGFNIQYLPNTVDMDKFPFFDEVINNHKLLWVRAFNSTYQPWLAVRTLFEVRKLYPDAALTMVGPDKGLLDETKNLIHELQLVEYVNIVGKVPNQQLTTYYHTHQVFLNTTNTESFGVAVMEAAICGIPIVTTSVGELPYIWENEKTAMLVNSFDEKDFAQAVIRLFENQKLYSDIKREARLKAESYEWCQVKERWQKLIGDKT